MTHFRPLIPTAPAVEPGRGAPCPAVGAALTQRRTLSHDLSEDELEAHIEHCTHLMELAFSRWEQFGTFNDKADADCWMRDRDEALRVRASRPHIVARMERERGLY